MSSEMTVHFRRGDVSAAPFLVVALVVMPLFLMLGCGGKSDPLSRSCGGATIPDCLPFEYSVIQEVRVTPESVPVGDPSANVRIELRFARCPEAAVVHEVPVTLVLASGGADAGASLVDVIRLVDDGATEGDAVARDGLIEVDIGNPFIGERIPESTDVTLRFQTISRRDCSGPMGCIGGTCRSAPFEVPYRLGARSNP